MQLKELFANETSRANTDYVKNIIYQEPGLYEELFELELKNKEPDLKPELLSAIELAMQEGTAGVKNRGNRMLKKLRKETGGLNSQS